MNESTQLGERPAAGSTAGVSYTLVKGKRTQLNAVAAAGKKLVVTGRFVTTARLVDEWYDDVDSPESIIEGLKKVDARPDILTFWQRLPDTTPRFAYYHEWDSVAAIPVTTFNDWLTKQLNTKVRNLLRKSAKSGITVKEAAFDDQFVAGMSSIFNETPIRQNRPFWHYGKSVETIKEEFSRNLFREDLFGAYHGDALVGMMFLAYAGRYAVLGQIISMLQHRDKAPTNALIAKAVEVCAQKQIPYLVYERWVAGSLGHFKEQNGFEKFDLPRYFVPLTLKGRLILALRLHHGLNGILPSRLRALLVELRNRRRASKPAAADQR